MVAEAEIYLRLARGETVDSAVDSASETRTSRLDALSRAFNALGLELDNDAGIIPYLMAYVGPKKIREAAQAQRARLQTASEGIFTDPENTSIYDALSAIDESELDDQDRLRRAYYLQRFEDARRAPETAMDATDPRQLLKATSVEFNGNRAKVVTIQLTGADYDSLPANTRDTLGADPEGLTVTLNEARLTYILQNGPRDLRKRAYGDYYGNRVAANGPLIQTMANLRLAIAKSEGKETWLARQNEGSITGGPEEIFAFYERYRASTVPRYQASIAKLQSLFEADGNTGPMQEYDTAYYERKFMETCFDINTVTFTLSRTVRGLLDFAQELYGVRAVLNTDLPVWAEGVEAYSVYDSDTGEFIGDFYADFAARQEEDGTNSKSDTGVTFGLRYGLTETDANGEEKTVQWPVAAAMTNVAAHMGDGTEAKITLRDIETVSHELFGHVFPTLFGRARGVECSGTSIDPRLREVNSQMWERIPRDPHVLARFVDEGVPEDAMRRFMQNLDAAQEIRDTLMSARWLKIMAADLRLHGSQAPNLTAALNDAAEAMAPVGTDGRWILAQPHFGIDRYAGNYADYPYCDAMGKRGAAWYLANRYNPSVGRRHRAIMALAGKPGANEQLIAFTNQSMVAMAVAKTTLGS